MVATDYFSASVLASFGLAPRDITGTTTTVANSIVYQGPNQLKCWQALLGYVGLFAVLFAFVLIVARVVLMKKKERTEAKNLPLDESPEFFAERPSAQP